MNSFLLIALSLAIHCVVASSTAGQVANKQCSVLAEHCDWEQIGSNYRWAEGLAITADGTLYFSDVPAARIYRLRLGGQPEVFAVRTGNANGLALGSDGRLYGACGGAKEIQAWDLVTGKSEVIAKQIAGNDLVVLHNGLIYVTDPPGKKIWLVDQKTKRVEVVDRFDDPNGIAVSPDQTHLYVAHFSGRFIYRYKIGRNGRLSNKEPFFHVQLPSTGGAAHADGMCCSAEGLLLSATESGIQVFDRHGRVCAIIPKPGHGRRVCYVRLHNHTMYAATADAIWKRKVRIEAANPFDPPTTPANTLH